MKTLKQRFKKWETISYTQEPNHIPTLIALDEVKQWLQEHRKNHQTISKEWETDEIDTYIILNNLIEEIEQ